MSLKKNEQYDFTNENGFQTEKWGPIFWTFLHCSALYIDRQEIVNNKSINQKRKDFKTFIACLTILLPCVYCRMAFEPYVAKHKIDLTSLWKWTVDAHNTVNAKLNKKIISDEDERKIQAQYMLDSREDIPMYLRICIFSILFILALNYPIDIDDSLPRYIALKESYKMFIKLIPYIIPTSVFSKKYISEFESQRESLDDAMESRKSLYEWTFNFQNSINNNSSFYFDSITTQLNFEKLRHFSIKK